MPDKKQAGERLFGLIGFPLSHSFSKKYFTDKFGREGVSNARYETFPIPSIDELPALIASHPNLCGLNVTIPYKEKVIAFLDEKDELVSRINACNCIKVKNGKLKGFNTDVTGFEKSLVVQLLPQHDQALILGTGGAAKAVQYVLEKLNIPFHYVSRKPSINNYSYEQLTPAIIRSHKLVINTTPLGMYPNTTEAAPIPYEALTPDHYLYDLTYNPIKTLFLAKGEAMGASIRNGEDMLSIQAEESWRIWNDVE